MDSFGRTHIRLAELLSTRNWLQAALRRPALSRPTHSGQLPVRQHGRSNEFDQVRDYQQGDDARHIDWRASARAGITQTRLFHREREQSVLILVEQGPAMFFASTGNFKSVQAALVASLFGWAAHRNHARIGGLVFGDSFLPIPLTRSQTGLLRFLEGIAHSNQQLDSPFATSEQNPLSKALDYCQLHLPPNGLLILICCESRLDSLITRQLSALSQRHSQIWLPVSDPLEHSLPGENELYSGPSGELVQCGTAQRDSWAARAHAQRQAWQQLASQTGAQLLPISTDSTLAEQLPLLWEALNACSA